MRRMNILTLRDSEEFALPSLDGIRVCDTDVPKRISLINPGSVEC
jgi:hypothetical protein